MKRRSFTCALSLGAMGLASRPAFAQTYPDRPIRMIVGLPPGGAVDTVARMLAESLATALSQPVVVENRAGAAGMIAAEVIARSAPDGYTIGLQDVGALAVNPALQKKIAYDVAKDFQYVGTVAKIPLVLVAHPSVAANSLDELTRLAKARPGKLSYASSGVGGPLHLAFESYKQRAGVFVTHIAYRGGAPALADVVAGHVDLMFIDTNLGAQYVKSGRVKPLAVGALERSPLLPTVPTFDELGMKGFDAAPWLGLVTPAGLPAEVTQRLTRALAIAAGSDTFVSRVRAIGFVPFKSSPGEFATLVRNDVAGYRTLILHQGIKLDD
ncbi:Bug family tripartite tricarboxylate transporter substrate binding protein [Variovorax gossypii]